MSITTVFIGIVVFVWIFVVVASIYRKDYTALSIITPVIVTLATIIGIRKNNGNGNGKEK